MNIVSEPIFFVGSQTGKVGNGKSWQVTPEPMAPEGEVEGRRDCPSYCPAFGHLPGLYLLTIIIIISRIISTSINTTIIIIQSIIITTIILIHYYYH